MTDEEFNKAMDELSSQFELLYIELPLPIKLERS